MTRRSVSQRVSEHDNDDRCGDAPSPGPREPGRRNGCSQGPYRLFVGLNMTDGSRHTSGLNALLRIARSALAVAIALVMTVVLLSPGNGHASVTPGVERSQATAIPSPDSGASAEAGAQCSCQSAASFVLAHFSCSPVVSLLSYATFSDGRAVGDSPSPPTRPPRD